jgi:hypothetical protein
MKQLLVFLFFIPLTSFSQNYNYEELYIPVNNDILKYEDVIDAPSVSADQLYKNAKIWFLDTFKSSKDVITFEDPEIGIVSGNGNFNIYSQFMNQTIERTVYFSVRIEVKENRFRYSISDLNVGSSISAPYPVHKQFHPDFLFKKNGKPVESEWKFAWSYEKNIILIEESLKSTMLNTKKEDW